MTEGAPFDTVRRPVFAYTVNDKYLELTATGFVTADEAATTFRAIRADPAVPDEVPYLMDLRQYDHTSMSAEDLKPRVLRMLEILGPKIGSYWAVVIDSQVEHVVKARLLQHLVQGDDATVMLFRDASEAKEWIVAMSDRQARKRLLS